MDFPGKEFFVDQNATMYLNLRPGWQFGPDYCCCWFSYSQVASSLKLWSYFKSASLQYEDIPGIKLD